METLQLEHDINVFYITAKSFPHGVMDAHKSLHALVPFSTERKYFGISRPENGVIVYKAATEEINPGEAQRLNCNTLILKKGRYISSTIDDYTKDEQQIGEAFKELLSYPDLDPNGYCVEWYVTDKKVQCMVRLKE